MTKKVAAAIFLLALLVGTALADTLYLKNGSVLKGTFIGYENGQFIFELENGRRLTFQPGEVTRLVIERGEVIAGTPPPARDDRYPTRDPNDTTGGWETYAPIEVQLADQWIRTPIQLTRGQRVRVTATGTIYLEGRTQTGPDGLSGRRDPDAPLPDQNDGALIAGVSQDPNTPPILIGRNREFTAESDGVLYFTVNHWETRDARGSFRVEVSVEKTQFRDENVGQAPAQGQEKTVIVYANRAWTDTGIDVQPNMTFEITAEGQIEIGNRYVSGPDGNRSAAGRSSNYPMPNENPGALIAKIRYRNGQDSNYVLVGSQNSPSSEPNEYGRLFLGINDDNFNDNRGSFTIRIRW